MTKSSRSFAILAFASIAAVALAGGSAFYVEHINRSREIVALSDAKMLGLAAIQYAQDHQDRYPDAGKWEQQLAPYLIPNTKGVPGISDTNGIFCPPGPMGETSRRFSLNPALSGKSMAQIASPTDVWLFYESVSKHLSASDNLAFFPKTNKNGTAASAVVFADGHAYTQGERWKSTCQSQNSNICGGGMPN